MGARKVTPEMELGINELYKKGLLMKEIAAHYKVCIATISLLIPNVEKRLRSKITDQMRVEIKALYNDLISMPKIANRYDLSVKTISTIIYRED